jgi:hypothetical protein
MADPHIGVLLPARLETRFIKPTAAPPAAGSAWKLKIAVIPDDPWMNNHTDVVTEDEAERLAAMWAACHNDVATLEGQRAFRVLAQQVGAARAWWLVSRFGPGVTVPTGQKPLGRMDAVPQRIEIWLGVRQGGTLALQRLDPPLTVDRTALVFQGAGGAAFRLFGNGRWWTRDAGLHGEYALPFTDEAQLHDIDVILAVGLGEDSPRDLFEAHRNAGLLSVLPLETPTNTISGEPAADLAQDADTWWHLLRQPGEATTLKDLFLVRTLQTEDDAALALPGGTRNHRTLNQEMVGVLWQALWGHTLKDVWCVDHAMGRRGLSFDLGLWAGAYLHPEGPIGPIRIGEQPYGVLPVTRLGDSAWVAAAGDPRVESRWLTGWLPRARQEWAQGARDHTGNVVGANTDAFVRLLGRTPTASDYGYRTFLPLQLLYLLVGAFPEFGQQASQAWLDFVRHQTARASDALSFPASPIRRYMTTGSREDLRLPLVEPRPSTPAEEEAAHQGGSVFFTQLERVFQIARGEGGMAALFLNERALHARAPDREPADAADPELDGPPARRDGAPAP